MLNRRQFLTATLAFTSLSVLGMSACSDSPNHANIAKSSKVIALGDSLTFGYGATPDTAYPTVLAQKQVGKLTTQG